MKLTLGTAQLGLPRYGRTNTFECPSEADAIVLIRAAINGGVKFIDSARAYGLAEERIGKAMESSEGRRWEVEDVQLATLITKLSPLAWLPEDASVDVIRCAVEGSIYQSSYNLRVRRLPVLMLHRWSHHDSHEGQIWNTLLELKKKGLIEALGASVYTPKEAMEALRDPNVKHLQIPFNLLDHRWIAPEMHDAIEARPDAKIHVRSAFLQGILLAGPETWPRPKEFDAAPLCQVLDSLIVELNRRSRADLCLAYLNGYSFVNSIVLGVETVEQLQANLRVSQQKPLTAIERECVDNRLPEVPNWLLDPSQWN